MQLKPKQTKEHSLATFNFSEINEANPPNQLKHDELVQGKDKEKWSQGMSNELGRLTQVFGKTNASDTFLFIPKKYAKRKNSYLHSDSACNKTT